MDNERREELRRNWNTEASDDDLEWRDDLTPEELDYVNQLDNQYVSGVAAICSATLVQERVLSRFRREEITELETIGDHCRLRLRDGRMYLARLGRNSVLRLDEIDTAC